MLLTNEHSSEDGSVAGECDELAADILRNNCMGVTINPNGKPHQPKNRVAVVSPATFLRWQLLQDKIGFLLQVVITRYDIAR